MYFNFDALRFQYEPFPIGLAKPIFDDALYSEMVANFPPLDILGDFHALNKPGLKFMLSEKETPEPYRKFIAETPLWRDFYAYIKSEDFVWSVLDALKGQHIDLGLRYLAPRKRLIKRLRQGLRGRISARDPHLKARFEFAALPGNGGYIKPHTDAPTKLVTLIVSMTPDGEWDPAYGGGTDVNRPKTTALAFNWVNRVVDFDDVEVVDTYAYTPNQAVIFIKTYNSWHSVRPVDTGGRDVWRKTIVINIEALR